MYLIFKNLMPGTGTDLLNNIEDKTGFDLEDKVSVRKRGEFDEVVIDCSLMTIGSPESEMAQIMAHTKEYGENRLITDKIEP